MNVSVCHYLVREIQLFFTLNNPEPRVQFPDSPVDVPELISAVITINLTTERQNFSPGVNTPPFLQYNTIIFNILMTAVWRLYRRGENDVRCQM